MRIELRTKLLTLLQETHYFPIINSKYYAWKIYYVLGSLQGDDSDRLNPLCLWSLECNWENRHIHINYKEEWWQSKHLYLSSL